MPNFSIKVSKHTDKAIVNLINSLAQDARAEGKLAPSKVSCQIPGFNPNNQSIDCDWAKINGNNILAPVIGRDSSFISRFVVTYQSGIKIIIARNENEILFDSMSVEGGEDQFGFIMTIVDLVKQHFGEVIPAKFKSDILGNELKAVYDAREMNLVKQEDRLTNFFADMEKFSIRLSENHAKKIEELEKRFTDRQVKADADYQTKLDALRAREDELTKRQAEYDLRESKGVRREIRKEFKKELQDQVAKVPVTVATNALRTPVWYASVYAIVVLSVLAVIFVLLGAFGQGIDWFVITRQMTFTLAAIGFVYFFIRWNNQWFQRHADEEFKLKALGFDIDKASWLYEMGLEWRKENQTDIPDSLLKAVKSTLIASQKAKDRDSDGPIHPMEAMASLLFGSAANITLKTSDGNEIILDRKSLKAIEKAEKKQA